MATSLQEVIDYYTSKIVLQYRGLPKATATMNILMKQAVADFLSEKLETCFDLATAVGPQLDILAKYIGVDRNSNVPVGIDFYGYADYAGGGSSNGYNSYSSALNGFIYDSYSDADLPTTAFTDIQFRFVLELQVALNHFDGTLAYIQKFLADFFPGQITVVDNLNMSLTYNVVAGLPLSATTLENFLPRPMGCGISVNVIGTSSTRITTDGGGSRRITTDGGVRITT